ncbi:MAG: hypothetical protein ABFD89_12105 [Bryobacteraceae bacterium]
MADNPNYYDNRVAWKPDAVQGSLSGALGSMIGYDPATGQTSTTGDRNLLAGPWNAFNQSQMNGLAAQGRQDLQSQNKQTLAGMGQAQAARGTGGPDLAGMLQQQMNVRNNASMASQQLMAQLKGKEQGVSEYNAMSGMFGQLGGLASQEAGREFERQRADIGINEDRRNASYQTAVNNLTRMQQQYQQLYEQYVAPSVQKGGAKEGEKLRDALRMEMDRLQAQIESAQADVNRYQEVPLGDWQNMLDTSGKWWDYKGEDQTRAYDLAPDVRGEQAGSLYTNKQNFNEDTKDSLLSDLLAQIRANPSAENPALPDWLVGDQRDDFEKDYLKKAEKERKKAQQAQAQQSAARQ